MKCCKIFRIGRTVDETGKRENGRRTDLGIKIGILAAWSEDGAIS